MASLKKVKRERDGEAVFFSHVRYVCIFSLSTPFSPKLQYVCEWVCGWVSLHTPQLMKTLTITMMMM